MYLSCSVALLLLEQTQRCYYWYHCVCSINWVQWYTDWCHISYFCVKCIIQGVATSLVHLSGLVHYFETSTMRILFFEIYQGCLYRARS